MKLDLLTHGDYRELIDKSAHNWAMKFAHRFTAPEDCFNIGDVMNLPFGLIKDIQHDLENGLSWDDRIKYLSAASGKTIEYIDAQIIDVVSRGSNYLIKSIEELTYNESQTLVSKQSHEEAAASGDKFNHLGVFMQIRSLAGDDVTKMDAVRETKYSTCFAEMYARKQVADFKKELQQIYASKKRKG